MKKPEISYLVDYDIPTSSRYGFYYQLKKELAQQLLRDGNFKSLKDAFEYLKSTGVYIKSTQSVILTNDKEIAEIVYRVAKEYGYANIYTVIPYDFTPVNNDLTPVKKENSTPVNSDDKLIDLAVKFVKWQKAREETRNFLRGVSL